MSQLKMVLRSLIILFIVAGGLWILAEYYSAIFSKEVTGEVMGVERLLNPQIAVLGPNSALGSGGSGSPSGTAFNQQIFSFSVGIRDPKTSEIHVATSEDRQWAIAKAGQCATARFYPYPPWTLYKAGTYFNARLIKLFECERPLAPPPVEGPEAKTNLSK